MSTVNAFALLATEASDSTVKKKATPAKKAPKKKPAPAPAPAPVKETKKAPAKDKAPVVAPTKNIPDSAVERKRVGDRPAKHKLSITRSNEGQNRRPPKREFDRHDGTGRAHEGPKKNGAGRGNWGKITEHGAEEERQGNKEKLDEEKKPELTEEEKAAIELRNRQRTLDQFLSKQNNGEVVLRSAAPVVVECSVDEKNFAPIQRIDLVAEQEKSLAAEKTAKKAAKPAKTDKAAKKRKEEPILNFQFSDGRRETRKEPTRNVRNVKVSTSDEKAFPSLS